MLFARAGTPYCYNCGESIEAQTPQEIVDSILALPTKTKFMVLAPIVRGRKGEYRKELELLRKEGFVRARIDGELRELDEPIALDKKLKHDIEVVIDRLVIKDGLRGRLTDSVELALKKAEGLVILQVVGGDERLFSANYACKNCGISYPDLEPRLFSFNSPFGACQACDGLGHAMEWDIDLLVPDPNLSLAQGAVKPWRTKGEGGGYYEQQAYSVARNFKVSLDTPWKKLGKKIKNILLNGSGSERIKFRFESEGKLYTFRDPSKGSFRSCRDVIRNRRLNGCVKDSKNTSADIPVASARVSACASKPGMCALVRSACLLCVVCRFRGPSVGVVSRSGQWSPSHRQTDSTRSG